jgi:hypothetical protein
MKTWCLPSVGVGGGDEGVPLTSPMGGILCHHHSTTSLAPTHAPRTPTIGPTPLAPPRPLIQVRSLETDKLYFRSADKLVAVTEAQVGTPATTKGCSVLLVAKGWTRGSRGHTDAGPH